ncbi:MAG: amidase family protein [Pseudonocardia sp.]|nr:amidase family protein [Pseudonocardia sp.]
MTNTDERRATTASDAVVYTTATDAIELFRRRELSPVELLQAQIDRYEAVNSKVNAVTATHFERALQQARAAEQRYFTGEATRPLEGIPVAIKDLHPIEGEVVTWGSRVYEGVRAEVTMPTVQRLFDAGAIMHLQTTTPEFGHAGHTHTPLWGVTRNPWNLECSSGGSSGGSAVAVAAGMSTIADGTDGGGSIRIPASFNGIFGLKPSFGRNPSGLLPSTSEEFLHFGPLTRSVADAALMQNVMSGPHPRDLSTVRPKELLPTAYDVEAVRGWKIAYSPDLGYYEVDHEVAANTRAAVEVFRSLGATVEEVDLPWNMSAHDAWMTHWEAMFAAACGDLLPRWGYEMDPFTRGVLERGLNHSAVRDIRTQYVRTEMYNHLGPLLEEYDVLICPTIAAPALKADHANDDPDFRINGKPVHPYVQWAMTYPFNLLGQCPVASVPSGFSSAGVPTGLQIVGRTYDELSVMTAAAAFEAAEPWGALVPTL